MNTRAFSSLVIVCWVFGPGPEPVHAGPRAKLEVIERDDGVGTLRIRFDDIKKGFTVEKVRLELRQVSPLAPASRAQTTRVEPVLYDVLIPVAVFDQAQPAIEHHLDLFQNPAEPYALAYLCLWLDRPDSQVTVVVRPLFIGTSGRPMSIPIQPESIELRLRNSAQQEAKPAEGPGHCRR